MRRLLLSIHDVSPRFEGEIDRLRDLLAQRVPLDRVALLVVPDHWGTARIHPGSAFAHRLRGWAERGAEVFLHGWLHRDVERHGSMIARWQARSLTAGEGEFLGLSQADALMRMRDGRRLLEDVTGCAVAGFVAPAWLYGDGAMRALTEAGFELAEDHLGVWNPRTGRKLCAGPVLTWASRSPLRIASSLVAAECLPVLLHRLHTARVGLHPGDTRKPVLLCSIRRSIGRLLRTHRPARYGALQTEPHTEAIACAS